jgi:Na+-translocating ferredoxin:NAD+ oxidoreductase RnfA subunit
LLVYSIWPALFLTAATSLGTGIFDDLGGEDPSEGVLRALKESAAFAIILIIFAFVREPLGLGALSVPGGSAGFTELFRIPEGGFLPLRFIASPGGALLLLALPLVVYRIQRRDSSGMGDES